MRSVTPHVVEGLSRVGAPRADRLGVRRRGPRVEGDGAVARAVNETVERLGVAGRDLVAHDEGAREGAPHLVVDEGACALQEARRVVGGGQRVESEYRREGLSGSAHGAVSAAGRAILGPASLGKPRLPRSTSTFNSQMYNFSPG